VTENKKTRLIDHLWVKLLVAAWVVGIVGYYFWLQATRLAQVMSR
jgi:hypothetical protein